MFLYSSNNLVHFFLSCRGAMSGGRGHSLFLALGVDHQENKFPGLGNELTALFFCNQRDSGRWWYLWYSVQFISLK